MKYNQTAHTLGATQTLENNDITEVPPKELEIYAPRQAPPAGALALGRGAPQSTWHGRPVGFDHRIPQY